MSISAVRLFLVIDTCVLLSHLDYLAALTAQWPPQQLLEFTIVIPDVVVRELDGLKESTASDGAIAAKARRVISWIGAGTCMGLMPG